MKTLECLLAVAQPLCAPVPEWAVQGASPVAQTFLHASAGDIRLAMDARRLGAAMQPSQDAIGSYDLHQALRTLIGGATVPAERVGVLFADRYAYAPDIFGIMFDTAFDLDVPAEGNASTLAGPPREGCAVFLGAIGEHRQPGDDYEAQTLFTTIHEMGHVFNLQHEFERACFMCESDPYTTHPTEFWRFLDEEELLLCNASGDPDTWPGCSPFGSNANADGARRETRRSALALRIDIARDAFQDSDPVELDITVSLRSGRTRAVRIRDVVDPGYPDFRLWIEEPNGERRLFRSPRRYCWNGGTISITPGAPFQRDISLFGESGGYTFRHPGVHTIWAELAVGRRSCIRSNRLSFDVLRARSAAAQQERALFRNKAVRTILYHRLDRHRGLGVKRLGEWLAVQRGSRSAASVRYAVARALMEKAARARASSQVKQLTAIARKQLRIARDSTCLGERQRAIANELIRWD